MSNDIKMLISKFTQIMEREASKYETGRMDVKQAGEVADIIKDLSEAEYHCAITETMADGQQDSMGYTQPTSRMGYGQGQMSGGGRQGYGSGGMMGHTDPMQAVRDMMATYPELRSQLRSELM